MNKKMRNIILVIIFILITITTIMSVTYAYYIIIPQNTEIEFSTNTTLPSCASVTIDDARAISLTGDYALPIKDNKVLNSSETERNNYKYTFTVANSCTDTAGITISLAPFITSNMPVEAIKYVVVEHGASLPSAGNFLKGTNNTKALTDQIKSDMQKERGYELSLAYEILKPVLGASQSKTYDLYLWVDYNEGGKGNNTTMDKTFNSVVLISDFVPGAVPPRYAVEEIKAQYTSQGAAVGNGVIYLHDSTLENGANDGSYRYAGADPDNYLCFEGDTCDDDHKYRIIGIFGDNIKVIKMTSVGNKVWNESNVNTWENSTMDTYLNGEWLTSFGHGDLIEDYEWHVGGMADADIQGSNNVKHTLDAEMASTPTVNRKVGLMYASDYGYAAENTYWTKDLYDYEPSKGHDWMLTSANAEWTLSRYSGDSSYAFNVNSSGFVNYNDYDISYSYAARPVFYLRSSVEIKSGSGSKENPWILGL